MKDGMNKVLLLGNIGNDPELRYSAAGTPALYFRVATHETYVDRNKEVKERTDWHNIVCWGGRAEGLSKLLFKGMAVMVEGALRTSSWEREGIKHYKTEVVAREVWVMNRSGGRGQVDDEVGESLPSSPAPQVAASARVKGKKQAEQMETLPY